MIDVLAELASIEAAPWTKQHSRLVELVRRVAAERDALAAEADPDALTICYMLGKADARRTI